MMPVVLAALCVLLLLTSPAVGPLAVVLAVNLCLWTRRAEMRRYERARARAAAEARRERERIIAWKSLR